MSLKKIFNCVAAIGLLSFAVHAAAVPLGDWDFCSKEKPCKEGEGDCDFHYECDTNLQCTKDKDVRPEYKYKFDKGVDVCEPIKNSNTLTSAGNNNKNSGNGGNAIVNSTIPNLTSAGNTNNKNSGNGGNYGAAGCGMPPIPRERYCNPLGCGPCKEGEGWCEKQEECKTGLVCDMSTNLCKKPCSKEAPCENGRECDSKGFCQLKGGQP